MSADPAGARLSPRRAPAARPAGPGGPAGAARARLANRWPAGPWLTASVALAALTVLAQVAYPLLAGPALTVSTVATVLAFAAASLTHAVWAFGARAAALTWLGAAGLGLLSEAVGVATGVPFGSYRYTASLGWQVAGVPLVVPLAWTMMAYPALLLARRLVRGANRGRRGRVRVALTGGWTLAAWDLFLDPQMVSAGHWSWTAAQVHLPGVPGIPLSNDAGWLLVGTMIIAALDRLLPTAPRTPLAPALTAGRSLPFDTVPAALLAWTWLGSTLANLAFFDRPWVAAYGGLAMAAAVGPYLLAVRRAAG